MRQQITDNTYLRTMGKTTMRQNKNQWDTVNFWMVFLGPGWIITGLVRLCQVGALLYTNLSRKIGRYVPVPNLRLGSTMDHDSMSIFSGMYPLTGWLCDSSNMSGDISRTPKHCDHVALEYSESKYRTMSSSLYKYIQEDHWLRFTTSTVDVRPRLFLGSQCP